MLSQDLLKIDHYKIIFYSILLFICFFLYYTMTLPNVMATFNNSNTKTLYSNINNLKENKIILSFIIFINVFLVIGYVLLIIYYYKHLDNLNDAKKLLIITLPIGIIIFMLYINILFFSDKLQQIGNSNITKYFYYVISIMFFIVFFTLFLYNINIKYNVEFILSIEILLLLFLEYLIGTTSNIYNIYSNLKNNDFSLLTINCFNNSDLEHFNDNNNSNIQINAITTKYGDNYLKTIGNIPISFYNKNTNNYQDLILSDFYYPGSYYSYLEDSPLNGTPSLDAIKIGFQKFKTRIIHLDIFSDSDDIFSQDANPIIRCENLKDGESPLNIDDVFNTINKWAWITDDPDKQSYPLFLYLNFNIDPRNQTIFLKTYDSFLKFFSKYLVDRKYGFSGRNNMNPISHATIQECLGKIILISNIYPTKTSLDEIINTTTNELNDTFNITLYKKSYVEFDKVGISQDNDKTTLINQNKTNITFYYTLPNTLNKNNNQSKAGMYNPSFQDCAQYGIQSTLMYIFLPDDNLNKWVSFFKNKNNFDPVLKDESLRLVDLQKPIIKQQDPMIGLQQPQKYCLIPGMMSTNKSNLSTKNTNNSCN